MTDFANALDKIGASSLPAILEHPMLWQQFLQQHSPLFTKVKQAKANKDYQSHLLGVLTRAHVESLSRVNTNQESVTAMWQALNTNLGERHAKRFKYQEHTMLYLVTHVWLYLQGYLKMDFSLANEYAQTTANTLNELSSLNIDKTRTQFMASFYMGLEKTPKPSKTHTVMHWLKRYFK
ncbi:hypothetical protein MHN79_07110 [Vibrio sp. Of14-4]|uniref:hypothetical protein n=1 Tax=Vibrio sp. Of14-4 TaxID=2724878 RepID=UPI001EF2BD61|nr:hypothetical protein [Vibrio sp. Of14-4]MCG7489255.1 hypothetical protein [Vibrio sp. Of14-4]